MGFFRLCLVVQEGERPLLRAFGIKPELKREVLSRFRSLSPDPSLLAPELAAWVADRRLLHVVEPLEGVRGEDEGCGRAYALKLAVADAVDRLRARLHRLETPQSLFSFEPALKGFETPPNKIFVMEKAEELEDLLLAKILVDATARREAGGARLAETEAARREKMLLHVCCGPDAAGVLSQLKRDFDLTAFWYDPNIQPREEHDLRLEAFLKVAELEGVPAVVGEYDVANFAARIRGLEHTPEQGAKCSNCYDLRLERAAVEARDRGCDLYATTLAISPHKVQEKLVAFGALNERRYGVPYFHRNFMKDDGFKDSVEYTREHGIYRQDYCGCWWSLHEGGAAARAYAEKHGLVKSESGRFAVPEPAESDAAGWGEYQRDLAVRGESDKPRLG
jgi:predicted adenine nucleotide alpha hydrolase (AANH) superfamily ATPase